jgi:hypothetical protein
VGGGQRRVEVGVVVGGWGVIDDGLRLSQTVRYGWLWLAMVGKGWLWLGMDGCGWQWLVMVGYGWLWLGGSYISHAGLGCSVPIGDTCMVSVS